MLQDRRAKCSSLQLSGLKKVIHPRQITVCFHHSSLCVFSLFLHSLQLAARSQPPHSRPNSLAPTIIRVVFALWVCLLYLFLYLKLRVSHGDIAGFYWAVIRRSRQPTAAASERTLHEIGHLSVNQIRSWDVITNQVPLENSSPRRMTTDRHTSPRKLFIEVTGQLRYLQENTAD